MRSARIALQEAYSPFLMTPENINMTRPKEGYKPLKAKARRVTRNRDGAITATPDPICHASETFTGRTSTTHRCAVLIEGGKIISAAENQPPVRSLWLQFAYNPYLDTNQTERNRIRADLLPLIWGLWCFWPKRRRPDIDNPVRLVRLLDLCMLDCARRFRTDKDPGEEQQNWWQKLGYSSSAQAQWTRSWEPHTKDLYDLIDMLDRVSLEPVTRLLREQEKNRVDGGVTFG